MQRKTLLYLFIGISVSLAGYLYYVDADRKNSIEKYFPHPEVGDIYKIKSDNDEGNSWLSYYKLVEISGERLVFIPSKLMSDASVDYLLNHYDNQAPIIYTVQELAAIKNGKWNNFQKNNTALVEIVRR